MSTNTATLPVGRYAYDQVDRTFLSQRVAQFPRTGDPPHCGRPERG
ncbi:hypothetical protein [Komagataeibacter saccharivorans]|nr:hypothetical protein [Komagataeibacter saccharivorans]